MFQVTSFHFNLANEFVLFQYGLYSAFLGCLVYVILGSCKESSVGPTAISAILIRENIHGFGPSFAILLCFLTGVVQLIMGFLQLGKFLFSINRVSYNSVHYMCLIIASKFETYMKYDHL